MNFWKLALKNLRRNRRRNLATAIAVALGYAGLVLITGYALRVENYIRTTTVYLHQLGHIALYQEGGLELVDLKPKAHSLGPEEQAVIARVLAEDPEVELWGRSLSGSGLAGNGCKTVPFLARGVELDVDRKLRAHP
jgi:ABC-type lipoprotein release transport system permease subunit